MQYSTLRRLAVELVRSFFGHAAPPSGVGITVIVHEAEPSAGMWTMAIETTLPTRNHLRALFGEAIAASVVADGGSAETAGAVAAADYSRVVDRNKPE